MITQSRSFSQSKLAAIFVGGVISLWASWNLYNYFFSKTPPQLELSGIESEAWYSGDIQCSVKATDAYKVGDISIKLDGKHLVPSCKINKKCFDCPFSIPTKTLNPGKHNLIVEVQNSTYARAKETKELVFYVDNDALQSAFVKGGKDAKVFQGRTLHLQFQVNKPIRQANVKVSSKTYPCFPESADSLIYECYIPVDCDENASEYPISIDIVDKVGNPLTLNTKFQVVLYPFKKQSIKIDAEKIKTENETGLSEKQFEEDMIELTKKSIQQKLWQGVFYAPTEVKEQRQITTPFGVIRTTQERGVKVHKAIDIYNTPKSVVWAPQDGIIVLKNRYAHSGNTVVIDHGFGILSLLFHLDSFANIQVGDKIKKGNPVGTLGKTGYATGYHVHWEMRNNNIAVDPMQWTERDF